MSKPGFFSASLSFGYWFMNHTAVFCREKLKGDALTVVRNRNVSKIFIVPFDYQCSTLRFADVYCFCLGY